MHVIYILLLFVCFITPIASSASHMECIENLAEHACKPLDCDAKGSSVTDRSSNITRPLDDVDGDNIRETLFAFTQPCGAWMVNCTYALYLSNKGCKQFAGVLNGTPLGVLPTKHNGRYDIRTVFRVSGMEYYENFYVFDGRLYKVDPHLSGVRYNKQAMEQ